MGSITTTQSSTAPGQQVAEVAILWSDTILDVTQLGSGKRDRQTFVVGEEPDCDTWIEPQHLGGATRTTLFEARGDDVIVMVPAGAGVELERPEQTMTGLGELTEAGIARPREGGGFELRLEEGWIVQVHVGEITFRARRTAPGRIEKAPAAINWSALNLTGASLLIHGVFLALVFAIPPDPSSISLDGATASNRFVSYLVAPPEVQAPELPELLQPERRETEEPPEAGSAHHGDTGAMGDPAAERTNNHYAIRRRHSGPVQLGEAERRELAATSGILSVLRSNAPTSPFVTGGPNGLDAEDALGALLGSQPGPSFGFGGLGVIGTGRGGSGRADSIGFGSLNTIGRFATRDDQDRGARRAALHRDGRRAQGPGVRHGVLSVSGSIPREAIRRQIRLRRNQISHCYQAELNGNPDLAGRVVVTFLIDGQGRVVASSPTTNTVSPTVGQCVARVIQRITFPAPGSGVVRVNYPFTFFASR